MRYEDVSGPLGDTPDDPELWRREAHPTVDPPTRAKCDEDMRDWPPRFDFGGAL